MDPLVLNGGGKSKSASGESGVATCSVRRDRQTDIRRDIREGSSLSSLSPYPPWNPQQEVCFIWSEIIDHLVFDVPRW